MANIIIKTSERRAAEARTMREFGIDARKSTAEQREYAERITADERVLKKEFKRMEEKQ